MKREMNAADVIRLLQMRPLIPEGGYISEQVRDRDQSVIYYLIASPDFSALHRLAGPEVWHYYGGAPVTMTIIGADGLAVTRTLGMDLEVGNRPQIIVPAGSWQGARSMGEWSLVGTTMTPPYNHETTVFATPQLVLRTWPAQADELMSLTRGED